MHSLYKISTILVLILLLLTWKVPVSAKTNNDATLVTVVSGGEMDNNLLMEIKTIHLNVKISESHVVSFRCFDNNKRNHVANAGCAFAVFCKFFHDSYSSLRISRLSVSPFYIAYHRLII